MHLLKCLLPQKVSLKEKPPVTFQKQNTNNNNNNDDDNNNAASRSEGLSVPGG